MRCTNEGTRNQITQEGTNEVEQMYQKETDEMYK